MQLRLIPTASVLRGFTAQITSWRVLTERHRTARVPAHPTRPRACPCPCAAQVLSGIQAPSMGRKPSVAAGSAPGAAAGEAGEGGAEGVAAASAAFSAPSAASIAATSVAEPFAAQAKFLSEMRSLNRCVNE